MLAAGTGWKVFDFFFFFFFFGGGGAFLNFNGVLPGYETKKFLVFGIFL